MEPQRLRRALLAIACAAAPALGLIAALATPGLASTRAGELAKIAAHQDRFYVYAACGLVSAFLLVPALFALIDLIRPYRPTGAVLAGVLAQAGILVAVGDSAVELMYWQMGRPAADRHQMVMLADHYENAAGVAIFYQLGALAIVGGTGWLAVLAWRVSVLPMWAAAALPLGMVANVAGFAAASQPVLAASYVVLGVGFGSVAVALRQCAQWPPAALNQVAVVG